MFRKSPLLILALVGAAPACGVADDLASRFRAETKPARERHDGYDAAGQPVSCLTRLPSEARPAILWDLTASCLAVGGESYGCQAGPEICSVPVHAFTGEYLSATIGEDGKAHVQIRDDGCDEREPHPLSYAEPTGEQPPHFVLNLRFAAAPSGCGADEVGPLRDLVLDLPPQVTSPAVVDFKSTSGSCKQALLGVASFLPPVCAE